MGTQTYDIILLAAVVALIAIILFWSTRFGADLIAKALAQSTDVAQQSIASYFGALCTISGDASITYKIPSPSMFVMNIGEGMISVYESEEPTFGRTTRIHILTPKPLSYPKCGLDIKTGNISFTQNSKFVEVDKRGKVVEVFVR